jgi:iron complex outermembrane receptor protein
MDRVEVLRGPQGTLFGRNATGGVVHYITRGADNEELNGYVEGGYGDYDLFTLEGAVGGSFTESVRFRVGGRYEESDGYIESSDFPEGNPLPASGGDLGGRDGYALRGALEFDLAENATLDLRYRYTKDDNVPTGGYSFLPYADNTDPRVYIPPEFEDFVVNVIGAPAEATGDIFFCPSQLDCFTPVDQAGRTVFDGDHPTPFKNFSDYAGFMDRETNSLTARLDWELANGIDLVSITNYADLDKFYTEDGDGIPIPIIQFTTIADFNQWSQELRFSGSTERTRWQVGGYYLDMETDADVRTGGAPTASVAVELGLDPTMLTDPAVIQDYTLDSSNWSVFGQGELDITDSLTLIAGLRWSEDDKDFRFQTGFVSEPDGILVPELFNLQQAIAGAGGGNQDEVDYGDWAGRLQLDWRMNEDILLFASFNRGIKGGNFAPSLNVTIDRVKHDEEVLYAYEAGIKSEFADGRARLNATAFYYDYDDYQSFTFSDGTPSVRNAEAENIGAELELFFTPTDNWDIVLGASLQDSEVDGVETPQEQVTPVGFSVDWPIDFLNGVELPNTPTWSVNYLLRYNINALAGNIALQLDGAFYDDQYLEVSNGGAALQDSYGTANARIVWISENERVRLTGSVENLTDEEYKIYALDLGILGGTVVYAKPRWWRLNASFHW